VGPSRGHAYISEAGEASAGTYSSIFRGTGWPCWVSVTSTRLVLVVASDALVAACVPAVPVAGLLEVAALPDPLNRSQAIRNSPAITASATTDASAINRPSRSTIRIEGLPRVNTQ
jgi:hypothetical protein